MICFWTNSCLQKVRPGKENKTDDTEEKETAVREQIFTQTCGRRKKCFQENQNSLDFLLGKSCLCDASQCIKPYFSWMPHDILLFHFSEDSRDTLTQYESQEGTSTRTWTENTAGR